MEAHTIILEAVALDADLPSEAIADPEFRAAVEDSDAEPASQGARQTSGWLSSWISIVDQHPRVENERVVNTQGDVQSIDRGAGPHLDDDGGPSKELDAEEPGRCAPVMGLANEETIRVEYLQTYPRSLHRAVVGIRKTDQILLCNHVEFVLGVLFLDVPSPTA